MKETNEMKSSIIANRIILGLLMLIPGLTKLFVMGPENVSGFLMGLGFPVPMFFAILLIAVEIVFGIAVLANYKLEYTTIPPMIVMIVAAFTVALPGANWPTFIMHFAVATNYWVFRAWSKQKHA